MRLLKYMLVGLFAFTSLVGAAVLASLAFAFVALVRAPIPYNTMAQASELAKLFCATGQKFARYDFVPFEFSFGTTGVVYRARFRPQHALPHEVLVSYTSDGRAEGEQAAQAMDGFLARFAVRHGQTTWEIPPDGGMSVAHLKLSPEGIARGTWQRLFVFRVGDFDWRYDDEIELTLEVLSPVPQDSYLRAVKAKLTVHELPYLF